MKPNEPKVVVRLLMVVPRGVGLPNVGRPPVCGASALVPLATYERAGGWIYECLNCASPLHKYGNGTWAHDRRPNVRASRCVRQPRRGNGRKGEVAA